MKNSVDEMLEAMPAAVREMVTTLRWLICWNISVTLMLAFVFVAYLGQVLK